MIYIITTFLIEMNEYLPDVLWIIATYYTYLHFRCIFWKPFNSCKLHDGDILGVTVGSQKAHGQVLVVPQ